MPSGGYPHQRKNLCKIHGALTDENAYRVLRRKGKRAGLWHLMCRECTRQRSRERYIPTRPEPKTEYEYWERVLTQHGLSVYKGDHYPFGKEAFDDRGKRLLMYVPLQENFRNISNAAYWVGGQPWHPALSEGAVVMQFNPENW